MTYCKLGDRAIIVHSAAGNEGKIVRIIGDCGSQSREPLEYAGIRYYYPSCGLGAKLWVVESEGSPLKGSRVGPRTVVPFPDMWLRPLPKLAAPVKATPAHAR